MSQIPDTGPELILWDVIEEHLEEGAYHLGVWRDALRSPLYDLDEVARGPEELLRAHVDGLVIGGSPVAERVLLPTLTCPEERPLGVVAALALLSQGRADVVMEALRQGEPETREAAREALELELPPRLERATLSRARLLPSGAERAALLRVVAARGLPLSEPLTTEEALPEELRALAVLASSEPARLPWLEALLDHPDGAVVEVAVERALALGSTRAWERCCALARAPDAPLWALELVALLGDEGDQRPLDLLMERGDRLPDALRALRFSGRAALVPRLLALLEGDDPLVARLAGDAIWAITGLDLREDPFIDETPPPDEDLPELEDDDLAASLLPSAEDDLPLPLALAIRAWWEQHGASLDARLRLLHGRPWTPDATLDVLGVGPAHRRAGLARWLLIHSGGQARLDTQGWSAHQRQRLTELRGRLDELPWRAFSPFQEHGRVGPR